MSEKSSNTIDTILTKSFLSYTDIIELALNTHIKKEGYETTSQEAEYFKADLLTDLKEAIENREIVPVDLHFESKHLARPLFLPAGIALFIINILYLKHMLEKPELRQYIMRAGGHGDLLRFLSDLGMYFVLPSTVVLVVVLAVPRIRTTLKRIRVLSAQDHIAYKLEESTLLDFSTMEFDPDSVIRFLNSKYSLGLEPRKMTRSDFASQSASAPKLKEKIQNNVEIEIYRLLARGCKCIHVDLAERISTDVLSESLEVVKTVKKYSKASDKDLLADKDLHKRIVDICVEITKEVFRKTKQYPDAKSRVKGDWESYIEPPSCKEHVK